MKKNKLLRDALILFAITLCAAVALAGVYTLTKDPIAKAEESAKQKAYEAVYPKVSFVPLTDSEALLSAVNEALAAGKGDDGAVNLTRASVSEVLCAVDTAGNPVGYVVSATSKSGYGGEVTAALGVTNEGALCGFTVLSHSETAGFGARCDEPEYKKTFIGDRSAADVDMISGATYTTTALKEICGAAFFAVRQVESGVSADA